jgi:glycosyltransferase involved in cell wall biosynthesis
MKVAIVHELLTVKGGAERVARVLAGMYPQADIFTLLYDERKLGAWFPKERVHASRLQRFAKLTGLFNHHLYLPFFRGAVEAWDFSGYDLIVSSSSAFVHGLRVPKGATHVCYVHAPARYLWDQTIPVQKRMSAPARFFASRLFHRLRTWDASVADRPTALAAASETIRRRIKLYWGRGSTIVHPPIDDRWSSAVPQHANREHPDYVLIVSTLARYKNIDIAIEACNAAGSHLIIVGDGPDRARLEKMAGPTVHFYGYREGDELRNLYGRRARGDRSRRRRLQPRGSRSHGMRHARDRPAGRRTTRDDRRRSHRYVLRRSDGGVTRGGPARLRPKRILRERVPRPRETIHAGTF